MPDYRETLRRIRTFPSLIKFLQEELDWPIISGDFEELTFDYTPEELGIDTANAAKIQEIKRLRPLEVNQPWGIFFVMFEPKRLPVVALRRILSRVVLKKRASANRAESAAWQADDLLFVSNFGEGDERQISFAHFAQHGQKNDLPTLKVLGWDNLDTPLHLDYVADELVGKLFWPDDPDDLEKWRQTWRSAFTLRHGEVINTSKDLAVRLAELARAIRDRIKTVLAIETANGPLTKLMKAFQEALVHDLDADGFADMYAQTIAYGLLSARVENPQGKTADDLAAQMTNPFLKELMETFLHVGGRKGKASIGNGIDFDELGVSEVVELLDTANMEAVVRDFGDLKPEEDPVIHFYELFLKEYDAKKKMQRGVFYTPRPVVSYIVRSVDELLRTEFGLADGLADTTTWGEMAARHQGLKIPQGTKHEEPFVQILDPATGTGTFLVEVIDLIHKTMKAKWQAAGHSAKEISRLWNDYVPRHLLPRLYGYELLMAPYAIAHMKIGLKLYETGYRFGSDERVRVYLTNALEPAQEFSGKLEFMIPALAHEAMAVNMVKQKKRFTVAIGNPPYSIHSGNLSVASRSLVDRYRICGGEMIHERGALQFEKNLQNDYVKFTRLAELLIESASCGVAGLITSHAFLSNRTLRGMRESLIKTFSDLRFLNLHGNAASGEAAALACDDQNVFDITEGVAISILARRKDSSRCGVHYRDLAGTREFKYSSLLTGDHSKSLWVEVIPSPPAFTFKPAGRVTPEFDAATPLDGVFVQRSAGVITARDEFATDENRTELVRRAEAFALSGLSGTRLREEFGIKDKKGWDVDAAQKQARQEMPLRNKVHEYCYRPFDSRFIAYNRGIVWGMAYPTLQHTLSGGNLVLIGMQQYQYDVPEYCYAFVTRALTDSRIFVSKTGVATLFPLYLNPPASGLRGIATRRSNISEEFRADVATRLGLRWTDDGNGNLAFGGTLGPEAVFGYVYALLHSHGYRERFAEPLKSGFPRVPLTSNLELFRALARLGGEVVPLHLMEAPVQQALSARYDQSAKAWRYEVTPGHRLPVVLTFAGPAAPVVDKVGWSDDTVWLDAAATKKGQPATPGSIGFRGVPEDVWNFHIGGYQVCQKWLKDRKGRTLSADDLTHYHRIVIALHETIRLMKEIDEVIDQHGGWPGAFQGKDSV